MNKEEIRKLIREGKRTSEIDALGKWPLEVIKAVKSEEIENEKKNERQQKRNEQMRHMERKRAGHQAAFLKRMGQDPNKVKANKPTDAADAQSTAQVGATFGAAV